MRQSRRHAGADEGSAEVVEAFDRDFVCVGECVEVGQFGFELGDVAAGLRDRQALTNVVTA